MTQTLEEAKKIFSEKIIDKCEGCNHTPNNNYCDIYLYPFSKWRLGNCPAATNLTGKVGMTRTTKVRVGQQKQRKKK